MTISSSLNAGVAALKANANRLATISDNIANSSTFGYKRVETDFHSMVTTGQGGSYSAGGVRTTSQRLIDQLRHRGAVGSLLRGLWQHNDSLGGDAPVAHQFLLALLVVSQAQISVVRWEPLLGSRTVIVDQDQRPVLVQDACQQRKVLTVMVDIQITGRQRIRRGDLHTGKIIRKRAGSGGKGQAYLVPSQQKEARLGQEMLLGRFRGQIVCNQADSHIPLR